MEESIARMMGEEPAYLRPMDAGDGKIGPLVSVISMYILFIFYLEMCTKLKHVGTSRENIGKMVVTSH